VLAYRSGRMLNFLWRGDQHGSINIPEECSRTFEEAIFEQFLVKRRPSILEALASYNMRAEENIRTQLWWYRRVVES